MSKGGPIMRSEALAERLRVLRAKRGLGLVEAADRIGVERHTLRDLERGDRPNPRHATLEKMAGFYGVPVETLLVPDLPLPPQEEEDSPVPLAETPSRSPSPDTTEPGDEAEERRVTELGSWVRHIERRAEAFERKAAMEQHPFLRDWETALAWDEAVAEEAFGLIETAEEVAQALMEGGPARGEAAEELMRLDEAYRRLWDAGGMVGRRVGEVLDSFYRQQRDTRSIERARRAHELQEAKRDAKVAEFPARVRDSVAS